jgi:3-oxoacyl-[acyl-carrier-protein] synthase II
MVNPLGLGGMSRLAAPSPRNCPEACRPFDLRRDGLAMGEGAALFVVESHQRALKRGAPILAEIAGWGSTQDGYRITAPRPDGSMAAKAMTLAMKKAGIAPHELDYINAHGTGTPLNDPAECNAIHLALGEAARSVPVSSIKGAVGHLMAAAGAVEVAACLIAIQDQLIPGTTNLQRQDPQLPLNVVGPKPRPATIEHVLSNSFGFGGQNATIVLRKVS